MPAILVRNISEEAHKALKQRAKLRGTSVAAEMREILNEAVAPRQELGLGTRIHRIFRDSGVYLPEIERKKEPSEPAIFE